MNSTGKEDKVSIVLPLYNAESTILFSIGSVLDQTYGSWELIIINDGSADNSADVVLEFINGLNAETKDKIIFLTQENKGPSFTRNRGIKSATGQYIAFLDSDDVWVKEKLEWQVYYLKNFNEVGIVSGGFNKAGTGKDFEEIPYYKLLFKNYFLTPTVIIKKEFLEEEDSCFNERKKYSEDQDLWLRLTYKRKGIYLNKVLAKNIVGKANFGESGLSANLDQMHKGEIENLIFQYRQKRISLITLVIVIGFSYLKYYRRIWLARKKNI
ncbi:glycosyltransferase family A protein [Chryseobacterium populi]|nr:glycosyltransferase family A protein [Chryseobacterium populi]